MKKNFFKQSIFLTFILIIILKTTSQISTKTKKNSSSKINYHNFCGVDYLETNIFKTSPPPKNLNNNINKLSSERVFYPVRIFLDTTFLEQQAKEYDEEIYETYNIITSALNQAVKAISEIIKVERYEENVFEGGLNSDNLIKEEIEKWDDKLNDLNYVHNNYDYVLFAKFSELPDETITAAGNPFYLAKNTYRPLLGKIQISFDLYINDMQEHLEQYLKYVFLHELIHAFGFLKDAFQYFPGGEAASIFKEKGVAGIERTYVKTEKVLNFAKKYFGCDSIKGVELENQGLGGSKDNHWDSRILLGELMTSEQYEDEGALSEFTLALLEDSGWYQVNYYSGGLMRFGKNEGCDFLNTYCISNNVTNFPNEYYDYNATVQGHPSCTTGRQARSYFILNNYNLSKNDSYINILPFDGKEYIGGSVAAADYCPVSFKSLNIKESFDYFTGNCKYGTGNYGSQIKYINMTTKEETEDQYNGYITEDFGEIYSDISFCMMNTLVPDYIAEDINNYYNIFGTVFHPMCFPSFCSSDSLTVQIYNQFVVCPKQGGNIKVEGYSGILHCPDFNLICTGTVMCNEIYDCIEKKSLLREESLIYDYIPITTQRYSEINSTQPILSYEKGSNGVCPGNCSQCLEKQKCRICRDNFKLIGQKENDENPIICDDGSINTGIGYYLNEEDGVYYKCHSNCLKCDKGPVGDKNMNCLECKEGFVFNNENQNCEKKSEEDDDYTLEIILSVVGGVVFASGTATISVAYVKKKKKKGKLEVDISLKNGTEIHGEMKLIDSSKTSSEADIPNSEISQTSSEK